MATSSSATHSSPSVAIAQSLLSSSSSVSSSSSSSSSSTHVPVPAKLASGSVVAIQHLAALPQGVAASVEARRVLSSSVGAEGNVFGVIDWSALRSSYLVKWKMVSVVAVEMYV